MSKKTTGKKYTEIRCPSCWGVIAEVEIVVGYARIRGVKDKGEVDFAGLTDVDWGTQHHAGEMPLYTCLGCRKVFDCIYPSFHEIGGGCASIVASLTEYDATWSCPSCGKTAVHDYEDMMDVGMPVCGDCDCDMERLEPPESGVRKCRDRTAKKLSPAELKARQVKEAVGNIVEILAGGQEQS